MRLEREFESSLFDSYCNYTPKELRAIADKMEKESIKCVAFSTEQAQYDEHYSFYCSEVRLETEAEACIRETKAAESEQRNKEYEIRQYKILKAKYEKGGE